MNRKNRNTKTIFNIRYEILVVLFLVVTTLSVYWQVRNHEFLIWDDNVYVTENRHVQTGLSLENIAWSFYTHHASNWHPLSWLSHMLDVELYGLSPGRHHLTNLLLHIINSLFLFFIFNRMTGKLWQSFFVAALFALHPVHVESVAWISERKDVLSTFFWLLTMWSYVWYVERPRINRYLLVVLFFILGLMSKPMLVTLPFVLLLMDFWPLNRFKIDGFRSLFKATKPSILWEKLPLFLLSAISSAVTYMVQQRSGAIGTIDFFSRMSNALVSYVSYIGKMIWPFRLAFFYPHPILLPKWQIAGACLILISIFVIVIWQTHQYPWMVVGWLWYVGTLVPVIGFVQVGLQSMADRYTYIPAIGLFFIIGWSVPELLKKWQYKRVGLSIFAMMVLAFLMATTFFQIRVWRNDITLFRHALDVTDNNYVAHNNFGLALAAKGGTEEAIHHYTEALKIKSDFVHAYNNLGTVLSEQGKLEEAVKEYEKALSIKPRFAGGHNNLGIVLATQGKTEEAIRHFGEALRINPNHVDAHNNLGFVLAQLGRTEEAATHYAEALRIDPYFAGAHSNLANTLEVKGKTSEAAYHYIEAVRIDPDFVEAHYNLGMLLAKQGRLKDAEYSFRQVLRIDPDNTLGRSSLDRILEKQEKINASITKVKEELRLYPNDSFLNYKLGDLYKLSNEIDKAIDHYEEALSTDPTLISALNGLAIAYAIKGQYGKALSLLKQSIEYKPGNAETYYYIASIYARQKKIDQSVDWLRQAVQRGYNNWDHFLTDSNLDNVRSSSGYKMLVKNR